MESVEIYRSHRRPSCEERAFVLHAVGIASEVTMSSLQTWSLLVAETDATAALAHLQRYERENPPRRSGARAESSHPLAWVGAALYVLVLLAVGYLAGRKALRLDWFDAGQIDTAAVRSGELWRTITALTLHADVGHLIANLGFGAVFGLLAGQLLGPGVAWASIVAAAACANLINTLVQPADHLSLGASTAVFATLGLLAAYAWRRRADEGERWSYRWAPLVAGVFLLAFTGAGGENTDVLAHLTGFLAGAVAGALLALRQRYFAPLAQLAAGVAALAAVVLAWAWAIAATGG